jgi:hypothetical protein
MRQALHDGGLLCSPVSDARFLVIHSPGVDDMPAIDGSPMVRGVRQALSRYLKTIVA